MPPKVFLVIIHDAKNFGQDIYVLAMFIPGRSVILMEVAGLTIMLPD